MSRMMTQAAVLMPTGLPAPMDLNTKKMCSTVELNKLAVSSVQAKKMIAMSRMVSQAAGPNDHRSLCTQ